MGTVLLETLSEVKSDGRWQKIKKENQIHQIWSLEHNYVELCTSGRQPCGPAAPHDASA